MRIGRRPAPHEPGVVGPVRVVRRLDLLDRLEAGDVAVLDVLDLDRATAEKLLVAGVAAVVNAAPCSSGRFPVGGARLLVDAGVPLVDDVGDELLTRVRDGDVLRVDDGELWVGDELVGTGRPQSPESVAEADSAARRGLHARVAALVADAGRRLGSAPLPEIDGGSFPRVRTEMTGAVVVVVAAGAEVSELRTVRRRLLGRRTVVVGVGAGADRAADAGLVPGLVVIGRDARPQRIGRKTPEVLVLDGVDLDFPVPAGVPRSQGPSVGTAEDTAVLLAHERGAALVVTCGIDESLDGLLDRSSAAGSVPLLVRLRGGGAAVPVTALEALPRRRVRRTPPLRAGAITVAALAAGLVLGAGPAQPLVERVVPVVDTGSPSEAGGEGSARAVDAQLLQDLLVEGRLDGSTVNVVRLPGAVPAAPVTAALAAAGAGVGGVLELTDVYLDTSRAKLLRDLVAQLAPPDLAEEIEAAPAGADPTEQTDRVLAATLLAAGDGDDGVEVGVVAERTEALLEGLSRMDAVAVDAPALPAADSVVLLVPRDADDVLLERVRTLVTALAARTGVVVAAADGGAGSGAGTDDPPAPAGGVVGALRGGSDEDDPADEGTERSWPGVGTIDHVGTAVGRVALVLGLAGLADGGDPGHHGFAADASAPAPDVAR